MEEGWRKDGGGARTRDAGARIYDFYSLINSASHYDATAGTKFICF